jgi:hypothetical protein
MSFSITGNYSSHSRPDPSQNKAKVDSLLLAGGASQAEIDAAGHSGIQALASKYGVTLPPPPPQNDSSNGSIFDGEFNNKPSREEMKAQIDSQLIEAGATEEEIAEAAQSGPEGINALAEEYGVELPKPPKPPKEEMKAQMDAKLKDAGATDEEIAGISSKEDVDALAEKYGVTLPEPPEKQDMSQSLSNLVQKLVSALKSIGIDVS